MIRVEFILQDIKENYLMFIWNTIQIVAVVLSLSMILNSFFVFMDVQKKLEFMTNENEVYMIADKSTDNQFDEAVNNKKVGKKLRESYKRLMQQIKEKNIESFTVDASQLFYCGKDTRKKVHNSSPESLVDYSSLNQICVSGNFFEKFGIKYEGDANDWRNSDEEEGVFLGNSFKKVFSVGDFIYDDEETKYKVLGFVESKEYYIAPDSGRDAIYLDDYIIKEEKVDEKDPYSILVDLDSTYFVTENIGVINDFISNIYKDNVLNYKLINYSYQAKAISRDMKDNAVVNGGIAFLILFFSIVSLTGNMLTVISNKKREYSIHMLCGASKNNIMKRLIGQFGAMYVLGSIIALIFWENAKFAYYCSVIIVFSYLCMIFIIPVVHLKRETINTMLRKNKE